MCANEERQGKCHYHDATAGFCNRAASGKWCFWHDPDADKTGSDIKPQLEDMARQGHSLRGFKLRKACLDGIKLVNRHGDGYDLSDADLSYASLKRAHLYRINLTGARLLKADMTGASMNRAVLDKADLLGVELKEAKTDHVIWGTFLHQEIRAKKTNILAEKIQLYEEAEEVARNIHRHCEEHKLQGEASDFLYVQMRCRRKQYPLFSGKRLTSKCFDWICGYGEKPYRTILFAFFQVVFWSLLYFFTSTLQGGEVSVWSESDGLREGFYSFLQSIYFSVVTFTTLGYGDLAPVGIGRLFAVTEAIMGQFSLALFVVVFVKRMIR